MVNVKNVILSICVVLMVMCFGVSCFSQDNIEQKPSVDEIKCIISKIEFVSDYDKDISDVKFDDFKITKEFFSKNNVGGEVSITYNNEVNYKISYTIAFYKIVEVGQYHQGVSVGQIVFTQDEVKILTKAGCKLSTLQRTKLYIVGKDKQLSFVKKGVKWYGGKGWR